MEQKAGATPIPGLDQPLTQEQAERLVREDPALAVFALLTLSVELQRQRAAAGGAASAPSSATPVYEKPTTPAGRKKRTKRGAKPGHVGSSRPTPPRIDRTETHPLHQCPDCGTPVTPGNGPSSRRKRIIEDIPQQIESEFVEHEIERAYCPTCKKMVEAKVPDALPGAILGHRILLMAAWLRFGLGVTLSQIREVFNAHLHFAISDGEIVDASHRIAQILLPWYEQIAETVKASGVINADETGWRVLGRTFWLWCFCCSEATYYQIDHSRGSPAITRFFTEALAGVLVTDFWAAYNCVESAGRQVCLPHLFREIDATSERDHSEEWREFRQRLLRLLKDALRLKKSAELDGDTRERRLDRLHQRLAELAHEGMDSQQPNVHRFGKRLRRHLSDLLTFLDHSDVPADNNRAEREIRPAVMIRKNTFGNQSQRGAETQAILMSVFRTLKNRGRDPLAEVVGALRHYCTTGTLPPLPGRLPAGG